MTELAEIERKYPVASICVSGKQVWPFLRWYIASKKDFGGESMALNTNTAMLASAARSFFYGFANLFRGGADYIFMSDSSERKRIGNRFYDKSLDFLAERLPNSLYFELPLPHHFKRKEIPTRNIVSKFPLYALVKLISMTLRPRIENESLLRQILREIGVDLNYRSIIKLHLAQYAVGKLLIRIYRPRKLILQCYYTNMGYVKAFRDSGKDVVEAQHGIINENHEAYSVFTPLDKNYFPNYLLVYGMREKIFLTGQPFFIEESGIIVVGSFYLDVMSRYDTTDGEIANLKKQFRKLVAITSQRYIEKELIDFIKLAAAEDPSLLFVFIPREIRQDYESVFSNTPNIRLLPRLNTYELIALSDVHCTVSSTCAVEAPSLGTRNVLINIKALSEKSFSGVFAEGLTKIVNSPHDLIRSINEMPEVSRESVMLKNEGNFRKGYPQNVEDFLKSSVFSA